MSPLVTSIYCPRAPVSCSNTTPQKTLAEKKFAVPAGPATDHTKEVATTLLKESEIKSVTPLEPKTVSVADSKNLKADALISLAVTAGIAVQNAKAGYHIAKFTVGFNGYSSLLKSAGYFGTWRPVQYVLANSATTATEKMMTYTVCGVSAGGAASAIATLATVLFVAKVGQVVYNNFVATKEEEKIDLSITTVAKKAFSLLPGFDKLMAAAAA